MLTAVSAASASGSEATARPEPTTWRRPRACGPRTPWQISRVIAGRGVSAASFSRNATVGAPLPLTDVAERLYAAADAGGHGAEDLSVVVTALEALGRGASGKGSARGPAVDL